MNQPSASFLLESPTLRLIFTLRGDRYGHEILVRQASNWECRFTSLDGTPDELWPLSPAIQEIHEQQTAEGRQLLGVGMAGKSHWSLSASVEKSGGILLDWACRVRTQPDFLGSVYLDENGERRVFSPQFSGGLSLPSTICWHYRVSPAGQFECANFDWRDSH